jgi:rhodanese-related sulfurtransferase
MGLLDFLGFGKKKQQKMLHALAHGAIVIDVRSATEFDQGHYPGSKNIPLQRIASQVDRIKSMNKTVILCCASGVRSGSAAAVLKQKGISCINGGSWLKIPSL